MERLSRRARGFQSGRSGHSLGDGVKRNQRPRIFVSKVETEAKVAFRANREQVLFLIRERQEEMEEAGRDKSRLVITERSNGAWLYRPAPWGDLQHGRLVASGRQGRQLLGGRTLDDRQDSLPVLWGAAADKQGLPMPIPRRRQGRFVSKQRLEQPGGLHASRSYTR